MSVSPPAKRPHTRGPRKRNQPVHALLLNDFVRSATNMDEDEEEAYRLLDLIRAVVLSNLANKNRIGMGPVCSVDKVRSDSWELLAPLIYGLTCPECSKRFLKWKNLVDHGQKDHEAHVDDIFGDFKQRALDRAMNDHIGTQPRLSVPYHAVCTTLHTQGVVRPSAPLAQRATHDYGPIHAGSPPPIYPSYELSPRLSSAAASGFDMPGTGTTRSTAPAMSGFAFESSPTSISGLCMPIMQTTHSLPSVLSSQRPSITPDLSVQVQSRPGHSHAASSAYSRAGLATPANLGIPPAVVTPDSAYNAVMMHPPPPPYGFGFYPEQYHSTPTNPYHSYHGISHLSHITTPGMSGAPVPNSLSSQAQVFNIQRSVPNEQCETTPDDQAVSFTSGNEKLAHDPSLFSHAFARPEPNSGIQHRSQSSIPQAETYTPYQPASMPSWNPRSPFEYQYQNFFPPKFEHIEPEEGGKGPRHRW